VRLKIQKGDKWAKVECIRSEIVEEADLMRRKDGSTYEIGTYSAHPIIVLKCECGKEITFEYDEAVHFPGKRKVLDCGNCISEEDRGNSFSVAKTHTIPYTLVLKLDRYAKEKGMTVSRAMARLIEKGLEIDKELG